MKLHVCIVKVEDELSVSLKIKTPSFIPKKKLTLCICVWTSMTWLQALKSTLPFKIASCNSWETTLKCFVAIPLWQSNNLGVILCHQSFLLHCLSLTYWKLISFLESFFSYGFGKIKNFINLVNSNTASRETLVILWTCFFCREIFSRHNNCGGYSVARWNITAE